MCNFLWKIFFLASNREKNNLDIKLNLWHERNGQFFFENIQTVFILFEFCSINILKYQISNLLVRYGNTENSSNGRPLVQLSPCTCIFDFLMNAARSSGWKCFAVVKTSFGVPSTFTTVYPSPKNLIFSSLPAG